MIESKNNSFFKTLFFRFDVCFFFADRFERSNVVENKIRFCIIWNKKSFCDNDFERRDRMKSSKMIKKAENFEKSNKKKTNKFNNLEKLNKKKTNEFRRFGKSNKKKSTNLNVSKDKIK